MASNPRRLLVVEDAFQAPGRGLVVTPGVDFGGDLPKSLEVELRRPDGSSIRAIALAQIPFDARGPGGRSFGHLLVLPWLTKTDVPIGTEISRVE